MLHQLLARASKHTPIHVRTTQPRTEAPHLLPCLSPSCASCFLNLTAGLYHGWAGRERPPEELLILHRRLMLSCFLHPVAGLYHGRAGGSMSAHPNSCSYSTAAFSQLRSCAMPACCRPRHARWSFLHTYAVTFSVTQCLGGFLHSYTGRECQCRLCRRFGWPVSRSCGGVAAWMLRRACPGACDPFLCSTCHGLAPRLLRGKRHRGMRWRFVVPEQVHCVVHRLQHRIGLRRAEHEAGPALRGACRTAHACRYRFDTENTRGQST